MHRIISFVWNHADTRACATAIRLISIVHERPEPWDTAYHKHGLAVFNRTRQDVTSPSLRLGDENGVIVGELFTKPDDAINSTRVSELSTNDTREIVESNARRLSDRYWGKFVGFVHDPTKGRVFVYREPSGMLPCYRAVIDGVFVFFSHIDDLESLNSISLSVEWKALSSMLFFGFSRSRSTCLSEVTELFPGFCQTISDDSINEQCYWNPRNLIHENTVNDRDRARSLLKSTTQGCVNAFANDKKRIVMELSGGVDSSIVASCLAEVKDSRNIVCLNHFTPTAEGDERRYARLVAERLGFDLAEMPKGSTEKSQNYEQLLGIPAYVRPVGFYFFACENDQMRIEMASKHNCDAVFSGEGGDAVFFASKQPDVASDYLWLNGINLQYFKILIDTAHLANQSIFAVLRNSIANGLMRAPKSPFDRLKEQRGFLTDEIWNSILPSDILHPWLFETPRVPPGKEFHLFGLTSAQNAAYPQQSENVSDLMRPLMSQPMLEVSYRIPVPHLCFDGRERALARAAFRDSLPHSVLDRTTKGSVHRYLTRTIQKNLPLIRDLILEGTLVRMNILDRNRIEYVLDNPQTQDRDGLTSIAQCASFELWTRGWDHSAKKVAA